MKPEEIAAYIGAAAWAPQIVTWVYRAFMRPRLRVLPAPFGEVGFTTNGPIFNVRMAFFVERHDVIMDDLTLTLRHQDGEVRTLKWAGLGETFSEITDGAGNRQIVSRDQAPVAVKVTTQTPQEKFVRFQEPTYHETSSALGSTLIAHFNFLKQAQPANYVSTVLESPQLFALNEGRQNWFWWKPGRYQVTVAPRALQRFNLLGSNFAFDLSANDIHHLQKNLPVLEADLRNIVNSNLNDEERPIVEPVAWQWVNPAIVRGA